MPVLTWGKLLKCIWEKEDKMKDKDVEMNFK